MPLPFSPESSTPSWLPEDEAAPPLPALLDWDFGPQTPSRSRATEPPSSGPAKSSPVVGTHEQKKAIRRRKGQKRRLETLQERKRDVEATQAHARGAAPAQPALALPETPPTDMFWQDPDTTPVIPMMHTTEPPADASQLRSVCDKILAILRQHNMTWGDLVEYITDPASKRTQERYEGLFRDTGRVKCLLDSWASHKNSRTGRETVREWAVDYVARTIKMEGTKVTKEGTLRSHNRPIDESYVLGFDLLELYGALAQMCPIATQMLHSLCTTSRQTNDQTPQSMARKQKRIGAALIALLGERSQRNSYAKNILGLYLYATGAQRQVISVLSDLGLSSSYPSLAGGAVVSDVEPAGVMSRDAVTVSLASARDDREEDMDPSESESEGTERGDEPAQAIEATSELTVSAPDQLERTTSQAPIVHMGPQSTQPEARSQKGLLTNLSESCRLAARRLAQQGLYGVVYDNINLMFKVAEQIVGRKDSQENGTCATMFPLFRASADDMKTADLLKSYDTAPLMSVTDIVLNKEEGQRLDFILQHTVLRIIVTFGGERFAHFRNDVLNLLPVTEDKIPIHKTEVYPLPAMNIDESKTTGNAEVMETVFAELGQPMSEDRFADTVRLVSGDQLSIARLRSLVNNRVGHDHFRESFLNMAFVPGLFHYQIHLAAANLETHWGDPSRGARDPGSLSFHNVVLDRKPIVLSSTPPYHTCRDLIFISLYARVLHCLQLVSGVNDLDNYAANTSFSQLVADAHEIVTRYANPKVVADLRAARDAHNLPNEPAASAGAGSEHSPRVPGGDMVFENAVLFMRDGLIMREFTDAIKAGDSGRIVLTLKILALSYRGSGRTKYAYETLSLLHNLTHVWPQPIREIVLKNWLVNPTGRRDAFIPVDLLQEHMNFWIKTMYNAQGSNASWEWLAKIGPCINLLRLLATQINSSLGSKQGTKHHAPDLDKDISELIKSLRMHRVYSQEPGRIIDDEKAAVPNIVSSGLSALVGPLQEYNAAFERLRKRRHTDPLLGPPYPGKISRNNPGSAEVASQPVEEDNPSGDQLTSGLDESDSSEDGDSQSESEYFTLWDDAEDTHFSLDTAEDVELDIF